MSPNGGTVVKTPLLNYSTPFSQERQKTFKWEKSQISFWNKQKNERYYAKE